MTTSISDLTLVRDMPLDPRYRAVCFDMDGTLLNTHPRYDLMTQLIYDEFAKCGVPEELMRSEGNKFDLDSGREWIIKNLSEEAYNRIFPATADRMLEIELEGLPRAEEFPRSKELLTKLREMGYKTGVLTRGGREYADTALNMFGMMDYLDGVVARDDFADSEAKPSPVAMRHMGDAIGVRPEEILYLGDNRMDFICARDSGAGFIAVSSGTFSEYDWHMVDPEICVYPTISSLLDFI